MLFTGFNVARGHYSLIVATLVGVGGNLVGSWIAYGVGYFGRIELVERHGSKLHISPKHLATADRWFAQHGEITVLVTRMMPIVRTFISLPAGVARMPFWRFSLFTVIGCLPWVFALTLVGKEAGASWEDWKNRLSYLDYAFAALIVAAIVYYVIRWRRNRVRVAA
jgi:membrane protein DedA with SNARE-associated domain